MEPVAPVPLVEEPVIEEIPPTQEPVEFVFEPPPVVNSPPAVKPVPALRTETVACVIALLVIMAFSTTL